MALGGGGSFARRDGLARHPRNRPPRPSAVASEVGPVQTAVSQKSPPFVRTRNRYNYHGAANKELQTARAEPASKPVKWGLARAISATGIFKLATAPARPLNRAFAMAEIWKTGTRIWQPVPRTRRPRPRMDCSWIGLTITSQSASKALIAQSYTAEMTSHRQMAEDGLLDEASPSPS
jgi:hypothetical protein